jgi:hypothetical protein
MNRLVVATLLIAALGACAMTSPAVAAERCHPRGGERQLARSAQAVVLERIVKQSQHYPLQTITGCSRRSGKRRTIDTLQRRNLDDPVKLIGLRLAGTRIAYAMDPGTGSPTLIAEDALHGGRRHDLGAGGWPFGTRAVAQGLQIAWAIDAQGDVAWLTTESTPFGKGVQALGVWHPGLGRRQVDSHALFTDVSLRDGELRWRRNGAPRSVNLASVPPSRCGAIAAIGGTLQVDLVHEPHAGTLTTCLRATGKTVTRYFEVAEIEDVNGPYVLLNWAHVSDFTWLADLTTGAITEMRGGVGSGVVDEHGSIAWLNDGLWVRDAGGTRKVADVLTGTGSLLRDGSTVTVSDGGPSVTLNP